jgi:arylsulfatase A-like enzyme
LPPVSNARLVNQLGELVALDRSIGMLRKGLRDMGVEKNTLVWYCSDNGGVSEDPDSVGKLRGHKGSLYEGGIRVPGIVEWPEHIRPAVTEFPASTMDIFPTVADLLGLPIDSMLEVRDGESIRPLFDGKLLTRTHAIPFTAKGTALIDGDFKLVTIGRGKKRNWELYDLKNDPSESKNLSAVQPERFKKMMADAEKLIVSVEASSVGKDYPEGRVIQPQRNARWNEMDEYKKHFEEFARLKPGFKVKE